MVFQSPHSPLSNFNPCNLIFRGERFLSAEATWQFTRATVCGQGEVARQIGEERKPFKVEIGQTDSEHARMGGPERGCNVGGAD